MTELYWNQHAAWPLLATLQILPLAGAALLLKLGERPLATLLGRGVALAELLLAILLYHLFDSQAAGYQFAERLDLLGPLGYHAGADGVTVLFVLLCAFIVFLVTLYGLVRGLAEPARLLAVVLATQGLMMSLLTTLNLLWFVLASAAEGELKDPVLVPAQVTGKNYEKISFSLGDRKFSGTRGTTTLTLNEAGTKTVLKQKCYK